MAELRMGVATMIRMLGLVLLSVGFALGASAAGLAATMASFSAYAEYSLNISADGALIDLVVDSSTPPSAVDSFFGTASIVANSDDSAPHDTPFASIDMSGLATDPLGSAQASGDYFYIYSITNPTSGAINVDISYSVEVSADSQLSLDPGFGGDAYSRAAAAVVFADESVLGEFGVFVMSDALLGPGGLFTDSMAGLFSHTLLANQSFGVAVTANADGFASIFDAPTQVPLPGALYLLGAGLGLLGFLGRWRRQLASV